MLDSNQTTLGMPVEVALADGLAPFSTDGYAHVRLRRERTSRLDRPSWRAFVVVSPLVPLDPDYLLAHAHDFLVDDRDGSIGVVDEMCPGEAGGDGTIVVACGWFGRRRLEFRYDDVEEIIPGERRLTVRSTAARSDATPTDRQHRRPLSARLQRALRGAALLHRRETASSPR